MKVTSNCNALLFEVTSPALDVEGIGADALGQETDFGSDLDHSAGIFSFSFQLLLKMQCKLHSHCAVLDCTHCNLV